MTVKCPTCRKPVESGTAYFPFCSDRCRLIDVGRWADEEYRFPAASPNSEILPNELPASGEEE